MSKKLVAINTSPRTSWNTAQLVRAAAEGAQDAGAEVQVFDLYKLDAFMGCRSCFGCMLEQSRGCCVMKDGLTPVLEAIRRTDALVIGTPIYFGRPTAGCRALLERLCYQYLTYRTDQGSYNDRSIPVLFMTTSGVGDEMFAQVGYDKMLAEQAGLLERFIGPVQTYACTNTLQTDHYERFEWNMFDIEDKQRRHEEVFPGELEHIREIGRQLVS